MKKVVLVFLNAFIMCSVYADVLLIESIDDCQRISNNVYSFWEKHGDLINILSANDSITNEQKKKLNKEKNDELIKYFKSNGVRNFVDIIDKNLNYITNKNNDKKIKKLLGETEFSNFYYGLVFLKKLVNQL